MRTKKICVLLAAGALALAVLPGCSNGIKDTITLVKNAEKAKQAIAQMENAGIDFENTLGTSADPLYQPEQRLKLISFNLSFSDGTFTAQWNADTNESAINIQVFASESPEGEGGTKIASMEGVAPASTKEFRFDALAEGAYFFYIKAISSTGNYVTMYAPAAVLVDRPEETGLLQNIEITTTETSVSLSWTPNGASRYKAILVSPNNYDEVLDETVVIDPRAKLVIPQGVTHVCIAVASYEGGVMGAYELFELDLAADTETTEIPSAADTETNN